MTLFDDLGVQISTITSAMQTADIPHFVGIIAAIVVIGAVMVLGGIAILRIFKRSREYVKPKDHLGTYRLIIRNNYPLVGNVNKDTSSFAVSLFERMRRMPEFADLKDGIANLESMWKNNILHMYDMRVFEDGFLESDKLDLPQNDIIIISPVRLDSDVVSWQDLKGERSITGSATDLFMRYPRNIVCSEYTEQFDVEDEHHNRKRVVIIAPYTSILTEQFVAKEIQVVKSELHGKEAYINIINLPQKEDLARIAIKLSSMNETYKELETIKTELDQTKKQRDELHKVTLAQNEKMQGLNARLRPKALIGFDNPLVPKTPKGIIGVILGCIIAEIVAVKISQMEYFRQYQSSNIDIIFMIGAAIIVLFVVKHFESKEKEDTQVEVESGGNRF